jgi:flagellar motor switch protein FliM
MDDTEKAPQKPVENTVEGKQDSDLMQDDIDQLFQTASDDESSENEGSGSKKQPKGLAAILNSNKTYFERLPILDVVFDRFIRLLTTSLRNFTSDNVEVSCSRIMSVRFSDYLSSVPLPCLIGVFRAKEWDTAALLTFDNPLIYSIVDVLLGGRKTPPQKGRIEGRSYTTLERNLIEKLIQVILGDFKTAFSPVCNVDFLFERLETDPRFAAIVHEKNVTMKISLRIEMDERTGTFDVIMPYSSIEPVRDLLLQNFMGEKFGRDNIWEEHLAQRIREANVKVQATLPSEKFSLRDVLNWKEGSRIMLSSNMQTPVELHCQNYGLFLGKMGQKNGHVAVMIDSVLFGKNGEPV